MQSSLCYLSNAACSWSSKRKGAFPTNCNRRRLPGSSFIKLQYESVSKSFRTGCLERELQMVQLPATRCNCIAILWVSLVSFVTITLSVASQRVIIFVVASQRGFIFVVVYCVIDSVRKHLDTPSYCFKESFWKNLIFISLPEISVTETDIDVPSHFLHAERCYQQAPFLFVLHRLCTQFSA